MKCNRNLLSKFGNETCWQTMAVSSHCPFFLYIRVTQKCNSVLRWLEFERMLDFHMLAPFSGQRRCMLQHLTEKCRRSPLVSLHRLNYIIACRNVIRLYVGRFKLNMGSPCACRSSGSSRPMYFVQSAPLK